MSEVRKTRGGSGVARTRFEQPHLATERRHDREVHEARGEDPERDDRRHEVLREADVAEVFDPVVRVERGEDHEEHDREANGEERARRIAPEALLLHHELIAEQADVAHVSRSRLLIA